MFYKKGKGGNKVILYLGKKYINIIKQYIFVFIKVLLFNINIIFIIVFIVLYILYPWFSFIFLINY